MSGFVSLTPPDPAGPILQASFSAATSGDILAASAGNVHEIYGVNVQAAGSVTVKLRNDTTDLEPARSCIVGVPVEIKHPVPGCPAFKCGSGNSFNVVLSGATQVSGSVWYRTRKA